MKSHAWFTFIAGLLGSLFSPSQSISAQSSNAEILSSSIERHINKYLKSRQSTSLLIGIYQHGEVSFKGYGKVAPDASSVFQIASVSKLLTTSVLMLWSKQSGVPLTSTLEELIGNQVSLSPQAKDISLYQLATHTSGLPRVPKVLLEKMESAAGRQHIMDNPYSHITEQDVFDYLVSTPDIRPPGRFDYSNYSIGLLAHIMARLTGLSLQALAEQYLLTPLKMSNTGIHLDNDIRERLLTSYNAKGQVAEPWTFNALAGAGGFYSTGQDMMAFIQANLAKDSSAKMDNQRQLVATLQSMHDSQNGLNIGWVGPSITKKMFGKHTPLWHNGLLAGNASFLAMDTEQQLGLLILSNQGRDVTGLGVNIMKAIYH